MHTSKIDDALNQHPRRRTRALVLLGLLISPVAALADDAGDNSESSIANAANNPAEPRFTLQYWN